MPEDKKNPFELLPGSIVSERYKIVEKIGEGGMGIVYKAEHVLMHKIVAVKVLHPELTTNEQIVMRFMREAQAVANIVHPNICQAIDFGKIGEKGFYFVVEYLEGKSLETIIKEKKRVPVELTIEIAKQICRGLEAAHSKGVIHRDLKPENIIVIPQPDDSLLVKILDFGIAKVIQTTGQDDKDGVITRSGLIIGTPQYLSPEQAIGMPVDVRGDLYSLGVILYEMTTGKRPFASTNPIEEMGSHITRTPPPFSITEPSVKIPVEFELFVLRLLEKQSDKRPASAHEVLIGLENITKTENPQIIKNKSKEFVIDIVKEFIKENFKKFIVDLIQKKKKLIIQLGIISLILISVVIVLIVSMDSGGENKNNIQAIQNITKNNVKANKISPLQIVEKNVKKEPPKNVEQKIIQSNSLVDIPELDKIMQEPEIVHALALEKMGHEKVLLEVLRGMEKEKGGNSHLSYLIGKAAENEDNLYLALKSFNEAIKGDKRYKNILGIKELALKSIYLKKNESFKQGAEILSNYYSDDSDVVSFLTKESCEGTKEKYKRRAASIISNIDKIEKIEPWCSLVIKLYNADKCSTRREVIEDMEKLGDSRVLPALYEIKVTRRWFLFGRNNNLCLEDTLNKAKSKLEQNSRRNSKNQ